MSAARFTASPDASPDSGEDEAVAAILADLRARRLLKWLFAETADSDPHPIGYVDGPIDLATQMECVRTWVRLSRPSPSPAIVKEAREVERLREENQTLTEALAEAVLICGKYSGMTAEQTLGALSASNAAQVSQ